jgi:hypothetical protein
MPATTENTDILNAINQTVQALIDLGVSFGSGETACPDVTVNVPSPDVTVNVPAPVVNVYPTFNVNCSGGGGSYPPQTGGTEGGTPPPGTSEPSAIDSRKCIVANILVQDLIAFSDNLAGVGLFSWTLDYSTITGILSSIISAPSYALLSISMAVGGIPQQLANLFFTGDFASDIPSTLSANQADIVCALYNAGNVAEAQAAAIEASGLTGVNANYLEFVLNNNALNMLFFTVAGSEAIINSYVGSADCSGCVTENCFGGENGWEGWTGSNSTMTIYPTFSNRSNVAVVGGSWWSTITRTIPAGKAVTGVSGSAYFNQPGPNTFIGNFVSDWGNSPYPATGLQWVDFDFTFEAETGTFQIGGVWPDKDWGVAFSDVCLTLIDV